MKQTTIFWICFCSLQCSAHRPAVVGDSSVFVIEAPKISWALYDEFREPGQVFVAQMSFDEPFALPFEILIPQKSSQRNHRPMYAIIGPGLPNPNEEARRLLPSSIALEESDGIYLEKNQDDKRETFFEPLFRRPFWRSKTIALALLEGSYRIVIFSPYGTVGEFVMAMGVEEDFSSVPFSALFGNWCTYAY